jgi:hypothetical protein
LIDKVIRNDGVSRVDRKIDVSKATQVTDRLGILSAPKTTKFIKWNVQDILKSSDSQLLQLQGLAFSGDKKVTESQIFACKADGNCDDLSNNFVPIPFKLTHDSAAYMIQDFAVNYRGGRLLSIPLASLSGTFNINAQKHDDNFLTNNRCILDYEWIAAKFSGKQGQEDVFMVQITVSHETTLPILDGVSMTSQAPHSILQMYFAPQMNRNRPVAVTVTQDQSCEAQSGSSTRNAVHCVPYLR